MALWMKDFLSVRIVTRERIGECHAISCQYPVVDTKYTGK